MRYMDILEQAVKQANDKAMEDAVDFLARRVTALAKGGGPIENTKREVRGLLKQEIPHITANDVKEMIVGTEIGIIHRLRKENPNKIFIPASEQAICPDMKLITLEKVMQALEEMQPQVNVPEGTRVRAKSALDRMISVAGGETNDDVETKELSALRR